MVYSVFHLTILFGLSFATTLKPQSCTSNDQCAKNECCQILSEYMVVSRRDLKPILATRPPREGTCQLYTLEGAHCDVFAKPNGFCGCGPGLTCHGEEIALPLATHTPTLFTILPTLKTMTKRDMRPSRPGYTWEYKCTKP